MINVLLVDDHEIVRNGIKALLEEEKDIHVTAEASNGQEAVDLLERLSPSLVILDVRMPIMNGLEALKAMWTVTACCRFQPGCPERHVAGFRKHQRLGGSYQASFRSTPRRLQPSQLRHAQHRCGPGLRPRQDWRGLHCHRSRR